MKISKKDIKIILVALMTLMSTVMVFVSLMSIKLSFIIFILLLILELVGSISIGLYVIGVPVLMIIGGVIGFAINSAITLIGVDYLK